MEEIMNIESKKFKQIKFLEFLHKIKIKILLAEIDVIRVNKNLPRKQLWRIKEDLGRLLQEIELFVENEKYFNEGEEDDKD